ncbi:MAG: hypothetical protein ACXWPM_05055 [Bdellovibrionota bacterium]
MKKILVLLPVLMVGIAAHASVEKREKFCKFETECAKEKVWCKVKISEGGDSGVQPSSEINRLKLDVDCTNGFDLDTDSAGAIRQRDSEVIVGTKREKIAVVKLEEDRSSEHDRSEASLVISDKGDAQRLEGFCKDKED